MSLIVNAVRFVKPVLRKGISYAKRGAKVYLPTVFGEGTEVMSKAYKANLPTKNIFKKEFWTGLWKGTKEAGKAAESLAAKTGGNKAFLKNLWVSLKTLPKKVAQGWKVGGYTAGKAGKNVLLGKLGGAIKGLGKRMPVIGSLLILGFELPNIIKATKEKGLGAGIKETFKAGAKLGGMTIGMAIGTAIGGPVGAFVGAIAGDWLAGKIVGKSYSEKKAEAEEAQQIAEAEPQFTGTENEETEQTSQVTPGVVNPANPFMPNPMNQPYMVNPFAQQPMPNMQLNDAQLAMLRMQLYGNSGLFNQNPLNFMA